MMTSSLRFSRDCLGLLVSLLSSALRFAHKALARYCSVPRRTYPTLQDGHLRVGRERHDCNAIRQGR